VNLGLTSEEAALVKTARDLARREFGARTFTWEDRDEYPHEYLAVLARHGLAPAALSHKEA